MWHHQVRRWLIGVAVTGLLLFGGAVTVGSRQQSDLGRRATNLESITIQNVRLEPAPPLDERPTVRLKFEVHNTGPAAIADLLLTASLVTRQPEGDVWRAIVAGPFIIHIKSALARGYTFEYEMRLRNVTIDCNCVPIIATLSAGALPVREAEPATESLTAAPTRVSG